MLKIYTNSVFYKHETGVEHPERPARLDAALEGVERAGLTDSVIRDVDAHPDTTRIIEKVHTADYEREFRDAARGGSRYFHSMDNPISSSTFAAARTSVAEAIAAADDIWKKRDAPIGAPSGTKRAFLIARPPGHHAERAEAMGFCFFNTIACVAEWLREQPGIERVFVFDFDAHRRDPLGGMRVTEQAYGEITRRVLECADRWCDGRVLSLLEGGYDMEGLAASVAEHVSALHES